MADFSMIFMFAIISLLVGGCVLFLGHLLVGVILRIAGKSKKGIMAEPKKTLMFYINGISALIVIYATVSFILSFNNNKEKLNIDIQYGHFYRHITSGEYEKAYEIMAPQYRQSHSLDEFKKEYDFVPGYNPFPQRSLSIDWNTASYYPGFEDPFNGPLYRWVKIEDTWYIAAYTWCED